MRAVRSTCSIGAADRRAHQCLFRISRGRRSEARAGADRQGATVQCGSARAEPAKIALPARHRWRAARRAGADGARNCDAQRRLITVSPHESRPNATVSRRRSSGIQCHFALMARSHRQGRSGACCARILRSQKEIDVTDTASGPFSFLTTRRAVLMAAAGIAAAAMLPRPRRRSRSSAREHPRAPRCR